MIQITDDQAPNRRHLRVQHTYGWEDVSSFLIQQHNNVVVEVAVISAGLRQAQREGEVSGEGEGGAKGWGVVPLPPHHYIWGRGGRMPPWRSHLLGPALPPRGPIYSGGREGSRTLAPGASLSLP